MSSDSADTAEVLSGEAVAIDVQPVGFFLRVLGALIDILVSLAVITLMVLLILWLSGSGVLSGAGVRILVVVAMVTGLVIVPCGMETALRGRSLGKLAVGGRIVRLDGGAIGFRHAFIRALVGVLETYFTVGAVALLTGAFTARSQRLGDLVAGTYSQRVRPPALADHEPIMPGALREWAELADVARLPDRLARRIAQFLQNADRLTPHARERVAAELAAESAAFVWPQPPAPPEQILIAMTILRRERETRALELADSRVERLIGRSL